MWLMVSSLSPHNLHIIIIIIIIIITVIIFLKNEYIKPMALWLLCDGIFKIYFIFPFWIVLTRRH